MFVPTNILPCSNKIKEIITTALDNLIMLDFFSDDCVDGSFFIFVYNVLETARVVVDNDKNPNRFANGGV